MLGHAWGDADQAGREQVAVSGEQTVDFSGKGRQRLRVEFVPMDGQEVIVEDIDQDRAGMAEARLQTLPAGTAMGADGSEGVDTAVQAQAGEDAGRIPRRERALDEVPHQPAKPQLRVGAGKIEVDEVIQGVRGVQLVREVEGTGVPSATWAEGSANWANRLVARVLKAARLALEIGSAAMLRTLWGLTGAPLRVIR